MDEKLQNPNASAPGFSDDVDSCCSTPFVSAPSSPGRDIPLGGFYFSAPSSPMHYVLSTASLKSYSSSGPATDSSFEFDLPSSGAASADELFFNGQIRPMKLSTHLQRPQFLDPLIESDASADEDDNQAQTFTRGRDVKLRAGSLRRRTRSMSPLRNSATTSLQWQQDDEEQNSNGNQNETVDVKNADDLEEDNKGSNETTPCASRSSSAGRNSSSKRWVFLKEFLYRSKSEGRNHEGHKFWGSISFSPANKDKKPLQQPLSTRSSKKKEQITEELKKKAVNKNGSAGKRSSVPSAHEMHYTAKRAQAEEMRKKTFLPYRQGLLGCLGFSSKSYGAMNGLARALNPTVSST